MKALGMLAVVLAAVTLQFSSRVNVVEVYVTVTDRNHRPVSGLTKEDFALYEDDRAQPVTVFTAGEMGLSVAVALDRSFSMAGERLERMKQATQRFLRALRPGDQAMLIAIGSTVEEIAPLSTDRERQIDTLMALDAWGSTSLHDAAIEALDRIQAASGRRALILLSDGVDRYSHATADAVVDRARRGDVQIYPIALGKSSPPLFAELASVTGGRSAQISKPDALTETLTMIADELRQQYLLGYEPAPRGSETSSGADTTGATGTAGADRPTWHRLRVEVKRPDVTVRARPGYWSH